MLFINRLVLVGLLCVGITAATTAQAAVKLFTAEWYTNSFGNQCDKNKSGAASGPHCTQTEGFFELYSNWNLPQNQKCNPNQPRCPDSQTPTDGGTMYYGHGRFEPLGGFQITPPPAGFNCEPWTNWAGKGATTRPANGYTDLTTGMAQGRPIPPLYRNPGNFTTGNLATYGGNFGKTTQCDEHSTGFTTQNKGLFGNNKGKVHIGNPVAGTWNAITTGAHKGDFRIPRAPGNARSGYTAGIAIGDVEGSFTIIYPYIYSYTYIEFRNDDGFFGPGDGPGAFAITYLDGKVPVATINVTAGSNKFGGTMEMLGSLTTKVCYYFNGGCSLGSNRWRYNVIGHSAMTAAGVVTQGYITTYMAYYYHTALKLGSTITVEGSRFPWTTGSITVAATGRGPGDTVHYAHGYDNRNSTASSKGTIQLVSPIITRWFGTKDIETGGIATLRIKFVPEPQTWAMLIAGVSLLGVGARMRKR